MKRDGPLATALTQKIDGVALVVLQMNSANKPCMITFLESAGTYKGKFNYPGGKVTPSRRPQPLESLAKELMEELKVLPTPDQFLNTILGIHQQKNSLIIALNGDEFDVGDINQRIQRIRTTINTSDWNEGTAALASVEDIDANRGAYSAYVTDSLDWIKSLLPHMPTTPYVLRYADVPKVNPDTIAIDGSRVVSLTLER